MKTTSSIGGDAGGPNLNIANVSYSSPGIIDIPVYKKSKCKHAIRDKKYSI